MNKKSILSFAGLFFLSLTFTFVSCNKKPGCTDPIAENYDDQAEVDDESCVSPRKKYVVKFEKIVHSKGPDCNNIGVYISFLFVHTC